MLICSYALKIYIENKRGHKMEWQIALALILATPVVVLPAAFVLYLNIGGLLAAIQKLTAKVGAQQG